MARMTKAQIEQQLAELQLAHQGLVAQHSQLRQVHEEALAREAALCVEADRLRSELVQCHTRIKDGHQLLHRLKQEHQVVVAQLEAKPKVVLLRQPPNTPRPVVTRFFRAGQLWEKTRIGNRATERLVESRIEYHVLAGKYDGDGKNCKFADVCATREEAQALLATVSDYPWSYIEERTVSPV